MLRAYRIRYLIGSTSRAGIGCVVATSDGTGTVTDGVLAEVRAWQGRPLEAVYPVVFFDALRVKISEDAVVRNKAVYLALDVRRDGTREILGIRIAPQTEILTLPSTY